MSEGLLRLKESQLCSGTAAKLTASPRDKGRAADSMQHRSSENTAFNCQVRFTDAALAFELRRVLEEDAVLVCQLSYTSIEFLLYNDTRQAVLGGGCELFCLRYSTFEVLVV